MVFSVLAVTALAGSAGITYLSQESWSRSFFLTTAVGLFFVQALAWAIWSVLVYPHFVSPLRHLPTPKGNHWLLGHGRRIIEEKPGGPMRDWILNTPNDGLVRFFFFFNRERVLVSSPKALAEVLVTNNYAFQKPENVRSFLGRIVGYGLLIAEGDEHKRQRRNLLPAFAFRHIKDLYPVFWDKSREVVAAMTKECGEKGVAEDMEIMSWASRVTLDIIGVAGLGKDFNSVHNENNELVQKYQMLFKPNPWAAILVVLGTFIPSFVLDKLPIKRNEDVAQASLTIKGVCRELIREKKMKLAKKELADVDLLSIAIESGGFSDEDLIDQLMTFLAAGHETTATAMTWAVYLLCRFPDVQKRLRQEVRQRLPSTKDADANITSMDIDKMPYLSAVCNEVLRYFSPVPITVREAAHGTTIQGVPISKGTRVVLAPWAVNVDPRLWGPDAAEFNPERWMPSADGDEKRAASGGATSNYAYMTFLHGPRSCIGQSFAKSEFACLLAAWIGRFEFELVNKEEMDEEKLEIKGGVTARPAKGLHVRTRVVDEY